MKVRLTIAAALGVLSVAGGAAAQQTWLSDRRYGEGIGIKTGNLELHPGIAAEFGYDSNFFQRAEGENGGIVDAWRLRITPSLTLNSTGVARRTAEAGVSQPPMINFSAGAFFAYSELFGSDNVSDQRNFNAGIGGQAEIAPQRPFGAELNANYLRSGEPSNSPVLDQAFDRSTTNAGILAAWRPGGGLLEWKLGYEFAYNAFEENAYDELNNFQHSIVTRGRWRFLPRTGVRYDARYTMVRYQTNDVQPDGDFIEARVGLAGLLTNQIGFLAMLGWNSSFYEAVENATPAQNYDGYVAQAELKWFTSPSSGGDSVPAGLSSIAAGYLRDVSNSYLGSFQVRDRGYLKLDYFLGGVFLTQLEAGLSRYSFPESGQVGSDIPLTPSFTQSRIDAKLFGEYRMSDTFAVNLTLMYDQALEPSDPVGAQGVLVSQDPDGTNPVYDDLRFARFQAYLGLRLFW